MKKTPAAKDLPTKPGDRKRGANGDESHDGFLRKHIPTAASVRDGVHFVVEILVLVFLIITFEVQAFVIPTGSLAPTLLGRHKDVVCPQCDYRFQVSAAGEVDSSTGVSHGRAYQILQCTCPMCRFPVDVGPGNPQQKSYPSFAGERVLVSRFAYQLADPKRWEIAPFKYPGGATTNYIKRLVGLPGETVRIRHGDLLTRCEAETDFSIVRKPPEKILAMMHPVYDNDYVLPKIIERGWPARWQPEMASDRSPADWITSEDYRRFRTDGSEPGEVWIRYRHLAPSYHDWRFFVSGNGKLPAAARPRPQLIADFCAYNTGRKYGDVVRNAAPELESIGVHWVGDLTLQCTLEVEGATGEAVFELVEGGRTMQCRIDAATGTARLSIGGLDTYTPEASTTVRGPGSYEVRFANVDDQLVLWVDGDVVEFGTPTTYPYEAVANLQPQPADLSPVGIASRGAALQIDHLKVFRDVYYIAAREGCPYREDKSILTDFDPRNPPFLRTPEGVADFLSDPSRWGAFLLRRAEDYQLGPDQFLALGDNSPRSKDSRLWEREGFEHYVSRNLLLGKALLVIWPHSPVTIPGTSMPCLPNIPRIRPVR